MTRRAPLNPLPGAEMHLFVLQALLSVLFVLSVLFGGLGCGESKVNCDDCLDPNVLDYRLKLHGSVCFTQDGAELTHFMATNLSSTPHVDGDQPDSDQDGIDDREELAAGLSPERWDTDANGFSDLVEVSWKQRNSLPPQDQLPPCRDATDSDGDGLRDCEEDAIGTDRTRIDSDQDGFSDLIELRAGTDPTQKTPMLDSDEDNVLDDNELRVHTNPREKDPQSSSRDHYRYSVQISNPSQPRRCLTFEASNIELKVTRGGGRNEILVHTLARTTDAQEDHQFACVYAIFPGTLAGTDPQNASIRIPSDAWRKNVAELDAGGCVCPSGEPGC